MQAILSISLPFFGLVFFGFAARRSNLLPEPAVVGLNAFVFWFALPALLFYNSPPRRRSAISISG